MAAKKNKGGTGGKRKGAGRKRGDKDNRGRGGQTPKQFMNALIVAGNRVDHDEAPFIEAEPVDFDFTKKMEYVDPVEFCQAVINGDAEVLGRCGVVQIPDLDQKLSAAKIAVKFTNAPKPTESTVKHKHSWSDEITAAENRVKNLRRDVESENEPSRTTTH